jgi:hypothetical protein
VNKMNLYQQRLNSFNPFTIAQASPVPGQAVGNMDGMRPSMPMEIPLEALEGTLSPEELKQEGFKESNILEPIEIERPQPTYVTDIPIKAGYRNIYGTNIGATYNPTTGGIKGNATIPIGPAEKGYKIGVEGYYNPGQKDYQGITPPPGYGGMIRFSKTNPVDPRVFEQPGAEKYSIELGIDGKPRRVPPQMPMLGGPMPMPMSMPGGPNPINNMSPFQGLLNSQ